MPGYYTFSAPTQEPPDRETRWKRLEKTYRFTANPVQDLHTILRQLKDEGKISQFAVVEFVPEIVEEEIPMAAEGSPQTTTRRDCS